MALLVLVQILIAAMLLGIWCGAEFKQAKEESQNDLTRAGEQVSVALSGILAKISDGFLNFGPDDLRQGQLVLTTRLLRTESRLGPISDLYIFDGGGRFVAGNRPLPASSRNVQSQPWFAQVLAEAKMDELALVDVPKSPLGAPNGIVVARLLSSPRSERTAIIGATIPADVFDKAVSPVWLEPATRILVRRSSGPVLAERNPEGGSDGPGPSDSSAAYVARIAQRLADALRLPTRTTVRVQIAGWPVVWTAERDFLRSYITSSWPTLYDRFLMVVVAVVALLTALGAATARVRLLSGRQQLAPTPKLGESLLELHADWIWELDRHGNLVSVAGEVPTVLLKALKRPFTEALGTDVTGSEQHVALSRAIAGRTPILGLKLLIVSGDSAKSETYQLSGQPNERTGGYWGVAVRAGGGSPMRGGRAAMRPNTRTR